MSPIWSTVILPIITSLAATGLVILAVWLFDRKRREDAHANQISYILNEISDVKNKMENVLAHIFLETAKNEKFRDDIKEDLQTLREEFGTLQVDLQTLREEFGTLQVDLQTLQVGFHTLREEVKDDIRKINEQVSENRTMIAQLQEQVSENRDMIYKLINVTENLQGIVENLQNIVRDNLQRESQ